MMSLLGHNDQATIFDNRDTRCSVHACVGMTSLPVSGYNNWDTNDQDTTVFVQTCHYKIC